MSTRTAPPIPAQWTDDCQGKKDFDGPLVVISTRYWPRGGGFTLMHSGPGGVTITESVHAFPETRPSAKSTIYVGATDNEHYDDAIRLAVQEFEADTEEEVRAAVEAWAADCYERIATALFREFALPPSTPERAK